MYHYLSEPPPNADIYRRDLSVSPALFAAHLERINAEGYTVISLYALITHLTEGTPLPPKPVVLTFDDGYRDNYENAFPLLRTYGVTATFFIVMEFINRERPEYLTWEMVKEMAAGGMSIEAHGVDHTTLQGRSAVDLEFQALRSYETLQNALGVRAHLISYPAGEFDEQTIAIFQKAGYWAGFTTVQGATHRSDDLFRLPRVRIRGSTTPDELARLLALDW
jgi:peptidoglycan/xylan/chitin deacetylase (PgdA/CDA1 family)